MVKIQDVFRDIFEDDSIVINGQMTSDDIEDWDSLTHIQLAKELENMFNVSFSAKEVLSWETVEDLVNCVKSKC